MRTLASSVVVIIFLVVLVYLKTKLEHDIDSNDVRESNIASKNQSKKKNKNTVKKNATPQDKSLLSKKFVIAFTGIVIEVALVFLGVTCALAFDNYLERKDVLRNVQYAKAYIDETERAFSELLDIYSSGKCDVEDIKFNVTINEAMLDAITETENARRQIKPLAISFVFSIREHIESTISLMNAETFDDSNIIATVEEILYLLDMMSEALSSIEMHLSTGNEKQLKKTIESLHSSLRNHQAEMYITDWEFE